MTQNNESTNPPTVTATFSYEDRAPKQNKQVRVEVLPITRYYIKCPDCGNETAHQIGHLLGKDTTFGPWACSECGTRIRGTLSNKGAFIEIADGTKDEKALLLVKVAGTDPPVFFIFPDTIRNGENPEDINRSYYVNEGTCPSNLTRFPVICNGETDPHGVLEFVQIVRRPDDWDEEGGSWHLTGDYEDYNTLCGLFTRLPGRILDGQVIVQKLLE